MSNWYQDNKNTLEELYLQYLNLVFATNKKISSIFNERSDNIIPYSDNTKTLYKNNSNLNTNLDLDPDVDFEIPSIRKIPFKEFVNFIYNNGRPT